MTVSRDRLLLVGFWLLPAALATLAFLWVPSRYNPALGFAGIFASQALIWMPWGLWSLLITALADRLPLERGNLGRAVLAHLALCAVVLPAEMLVISATTRAFGLVADDAPRHLDSILALGLRQYGDMLFVVYWAVVGADTAWRWHARWRAASLREARLGEDLAQARLEALRAQLNPHFLFNSLNAIVSLIDRNPAAAQQMTIRLADLLRATLAAGDVQQQSLREELELTRRYLEIEQVRFADRLSVTWAIAPGLDDVRVPAFALQPLVENAIRHGIARRPGAGMIEIASWADGDTVVLRVSDDGHGLRPDAAPESRAGAGIALRNLRARLERLHGAGATLSLTPRDGGGAVSEIRLPSSSSNLPAAVRSVA
jgi:Histidine kinase